MSDSTQLEKKERKDVYGPLSEAFPQEMERTLNKGGTNLTYIPVSEVINRMNKVLGVENWSFSIKGYTEIGDSIVAHVTVIAVIEGKEVSRDGVGGQKIKRIKATGLAVDYGDEVKGAVTTIADTQTGGTGKLAGDALRDAWSGVVAGRMPNSANLKLVFEKQVRWTTQ